MPQEKWNHSRPSRENYSERHTREEGRTTYGSLECGSMVRSSLIRLFMLSRRFRSTANEKDKRNQMRPRNSYKYEKRSINQSINQSFIRTIIRPINQSINQSINHSCNQSIHQSIIRPINLQVLHQLISQYKIWVVMKSVIRCHGEREHWTRVEDLSEDQQHFGTYWCCDCPFSDGLWSSICRLPRWLRIRSSRHEDWQGRRRKRVRRVCRWRGRACASNPGCPSPEERRITMRMHEKITIKQVEDGIGSFTKQVEDGIGSFIK